MLAVAQQNRTKVTTASSNFRKTDDKQKQNKGGKKSRPKVSDQWKKTMGEVTQL